MAKEVCCDIIGNLHLQNIQHIILQIFSYFDIDDLQTCSQVSSLWNEALSNKQLWEAASKQQFDSFIDSSFSAKLVPFPIIGSAVEYYKLSLKRRAMIDLWLKEDNITTWFSYC